MDGNGGGNSIRRFPDPGTLRPGRALSRAVSPARGAHVAVRARARRGAHPRHGRRARGSDQPRAAATPSRHRLRRSDAVRGVSAPALGDDPVLREDLSNWFSLLGEPALAASTLELLAASQSGPDAGACRLRRRHATAAPVKRAALARRSSARCFALDDPTAAEQLGALGAWAEDVLLRGGGRLLPGGAAAPRTAGRSRDGGRGAVPRVRDRAGVGVAAERLAASLSEAGRAAPPTRCAASTRAGSARGGAGRALAAAARSAPRGDWVARSARPSTRGSTPSSTSRSVLSVIASDEPDDLPNEPSGLDGVRFRLGLFDLLAARLELSCEVLAGKESGRVWRALARLYARELGRADRALESWVEAFVTDPENDEAYEALVRYSAAPRDPQPLVEALGACCSTSPASRRAADPARAFDARRRAHRRSEACRLRARASPRRRRPRRSRRSSSASVIAINGSRSSTPSSRT